MQKYIELLEKHVQWIAIGLGGLFVLFMVWTYALNSPAEVMIGNEKLGPSEVDPYTVEKVAKPLEAQITNMDKIEIPVPTYVQSFKDTMAWKGAPDITASAMPWDSHSKDIELPKVPGAPGAIVGGTPGSVGTPETGGGIDKVAELPAVPAAKWVEARFGRSVVIPPAVNGQPGAPVPPPAPAAPGQAVPGAVDKDWVTQLFSINVADIDASFKKVKVPPAFTKTMFLQVEMEREELDVNGKPIANSLTVIAPLPVWRTAAPPPFPADGLPGRVNQPPYLQWASANSPDILQPLFYATIPGQGDQWTKPGNQVSTTDVFDPATFKGDLSTLTVEQRNQVLQYRRDLHKAADEQKKTARPAPAPRTAPGGRGGPPGMPSEGNFAPAAPAHNAAPTHAAPAPTRAPVAPVPHIPPRIPPGMPRDAMEGDMGAGGGFAGAGAAAPPGLPQPGVDYPNGEFDPATPPFNTKTIETWAHDETAVAGKTYHYRIRYKLKNPIFGAGNVAQNDALSQVFALVSAPSEWSSPITIPQLVNFFVQSSKSPNSNTVRFDVYSWSGGKQNNATFVVGPGDQVGSVNTQTKIDYSTDWTVVDFRDDPRQGDTQILLVNNKDGSVIVRSFQADQKDTLYKGLKEQIQSLRAAESASAAGTGAPGAGGPAR